MNQSRRDELIHHVQYGLMTPAEAEAEAARLGLGPLASRPDPKQHDNPMEEMWWTLPMAIAWIAWRNSADVLDCYDPYREQCWYWYYQEWRVGPDSPVYKGHFLKQRPRATLVLLSLSERHDIAAGPERDRVMSVSDATAQLWKALQRNSLQAIARFRYGDRRAPIADHEWLDLKPIEENGRDVLIRDPLSHAGYHDVAVRRQSVMALRPPKQPEPVPRLPETVRPVGPGTFPLYCAAQWIATHGGSREFDPTDAAIWDAAYRELTAHITSGLVTVTGIRSGVRERIDRHIFASLRIDYPFSELSTGLTLSEEMYLCSYPYIDDDHWRGGFDDSLRTRTGTEWTKLMVLKSEIAQLWPFDSAIQEIRTGAPGRPTPMHLVHAEHQRRLDHGEAEQSVAAESNLLEAWLRKSHPSAPRLTAKTIENNIRDRHRKAKKP